MPIKTEVMRQIGIDICTLSEVDVFKHLVVCSLNALFNKWLDGKPIKDKSAFTFAQFLYEVICRHVCRKIQINDQVRKLVNETSKILHNMIGTEQRIPLAYHPQ